MIDFIFLAPFDVQIEFSVKSPCKEDSHLLSLLLNEKPQHKIIFVPIHKLYYTNNMKNILQYYLIWDVIFYHWGCHTQIKAIHVQM